MVTYPLTLSCGVKRITPAPSLKCIVTSQKPIQVCICTAKCYTRPLGQRQECQGVHGSTPPPVLKGIARSPKSSQMLQQAVGTEARKPMQMCTIMCVNDVVCMCMCMCMSIKRCTRPLGQRPESQYKSYSGTYLYHIYQRQSCQRKRHLCDAAF